MLKYKHIAKGGWQYVNLERRKKERKLSLPGSLLIFLSSCRTAVGVDFPLNRRGFSRYNFCDSSVNFSM